ncbi:MAG: hypothetical protein HYV09_37185 [Deltaproteobacteria bacterium]|nr:hypothetical protein [Deltaproteobacteria bacterium]
MRARAIRSTGLFAILASCIHGGGPPAIAPTAKLAPKVDDDAPRTAAAFAVVYSGPTGAVERRDDAIVTVLFNRAMRSLDDPEDANVPPAKITARDGRVIGGRFRWVGTRGLIFEPQGGSLPAASELEVSVPAGTKALDGSALPHEHKFAFDTSRPTVVSAPFAGRKDLTADGAMRLELDQNVDPAEAQKQLKLVARTRADAPPKTIAFTARRASKAAPAKALRIIELVPTEKLPLDAQVEVVIPKGFKAGEGPLGTLQEQKLTARTYGPLRLSDVQCPKQELGRCRANHEIAVLLSNSVPRKDFLAHLAVKGGDPAKLLVAKNASPTATAHTIVARPTPGKRYQVTIRKGLKDVFGQVLDKDITFAVDTEAPFVGGNKKVAAAASDDEPPEQSNVPAGPLPGVPHRPKLDFQAQIGLRGQVVEAASNDGIKSHKVPIGVVNVPTVGVWSGALDEAGVVRWLGGSHATGPDGADWAWSWFTPGVPENVRAVKTIDLDALLGKKKGAALLALSVPSQPAPFDSALVSVTDLAVSARMSKFGGLVWVTRLSTGAPVANASVRVVRLSPKKPALAEAFAGTTDASGLVTIPADKYDPTKAAEGALVMVKAGDDWTWARVEHGKAGLASWWDVDLTARPSYKALLFTERGVYRPGETMKLAGIVRRGSAKGLEPPAGKDLKLQVSDGEGNEVLVTRAKIDAFGTFAVDVPLGKTAKLGTGAITASIGAESSVAYSTFLLAAYKASAFKIGVEPAKPAYVHGDEATFGVSGEYLYGAAMSGATVHAEITRAPVSFVPPKAEGFVFGDETRGYVAAHVDRIDADLDAKGRFDAKVKLDLPGQYGPERVTIEAEVKDATHQTVAKSASALVHPAEFYLGLERAGSRFVSLPGASLEVRPKVAAFEPSGARRVGAKVTLELVQRKWTSSVAEQADGSSSTWSKPKDELVASCEVTTTAKTESCPLLVKEPGYYFIRGRARDARNLETRVADWILAVADQPDAKVAPSWSKTDLKVVKLEADKTVYKPGDKAKILVHNPFPTTKDVQALVTVERGGVLDRQLVSLKGSMPVVEIPVKSEWFPNAFVSIDVVRGRIKPPPGKGVDLGGPEFRVGTTELKVDPESHRLKLAITPSKTKLAPGEALDADVAVTDDAGKPTKASVTFYAVDEGVLMLTGYKTPDPLPPFAERQKLAVFGFDSREHLARILPMKAGEKVPILGWEYPERDGWEKGSEYGDGDMAEAGPGGARPRMDFRATAFFEAGRVTADDGHAKFHVKLPDNLTSYRLMAVAATGDDRFGFGESNITASKKLMIRPALPRALRVGDAFEASMVLTSKDLPSTDVEVRIAAKGLVVDGPTSFHAQVGPGQQVPVRFKVRATSPGTATLDVEAKGGGTADRVVLTRTVSLPTSLRTVAAYGETSSASAVELGPLDGIRPDEGGLKVKVASSAMVGLDTSFDRLVEYPYGCTEQIVSRVLPLVSMRDLAKQAGVRMPAKTDAMIDDAIAKVVAHQSGNGGFGFWENDPAVPWLSAYATLVLEEAGKKGYAVPKESRDRAMSYLRGHLPSMIPAPEGEDQPAPPDDDSAVEDDAHGPVVEPMSPTDERGVKFAIASMIVDALASSGVPDPGAMNRLYDARAKKPVFAQAFLLHAMAAAKMPQQQLAGFAKELEGRLKVDAGSAVAMPEGPVYAPMLDSSARTTALVLRALLAVDAKHPLAPRLARGLLNARVDGAWRSTQENVWALVALDAYRKAQESAPAGFEARAFFGDDEIGRAKLSGLQEETFALPAAKLSAKKGPLTVTLDGPGKLFWSAELRYATTVLPTKPLDRGFYIEKRVRGLLPGDLGKALESMPKSSSSKARIGELVLVDLLFETAEARDQVVIDDPLPAGLEPLDVKLETVAKSQNVGDGPALAHATATKTHPTYVYPSLHREHRDDRVLTFLGRVEPGLYHFRYVARATSAGTFVVPPTTVEAMYTPEVSGRTAATSFTVTRE